MSNDNNPLVALSKTLADAAEKAGAATVLVRGRQRMPSSGIAYAGHLILTADHTVEGDEGIAVVLPDGTEIGAEVAGRDPSSDIALLRLSQDAGIVAEVVQHDVRVGELVLAVGRPSTEGIEASLGVVSAISGPARTRRGGMIERYIRTDAVPLPGFSGGPLVNSEGLIVGINTSGLAHGMLLTLPASVAWGTARSLDEHGSIKRGYLGIRSQQVALPETARESLGRAQDSGLLIVHIEAESPAAASDLMVGDIIVGLAGLPVRDHDELLGRMVGETVGKPVPVEVLRGGVLASFEVILSERPTSHHPRHGWRHGHHRHHPHR